jgi:hypothetical protein
MIILDIWVLPASFGRALRVLHRSPCSASSMRRWKARSTGSTNRSNLVLFLHLCWTRASVGHRQCPWADPGLLGQVGCDHPCRDPFHLFSQISLIQVFGDEKQFDTGGSSVFGWSVAAQPWQNVQDSPDVIGSAEKFTFQGSKVKEEYSL